MNSPLATGLLEIVDTADGERMRLTISSHAHDLQAVVSIKRPGNVIETLRLLPSATDHHAMQSAEVPAEPHEFDAELRLTAGDKQDVLPFRMEEPEGHHH